MALRAILDQTQAVRTCEFTERAEFGWLDVVGARPTLVDVLSVFIALLELAKRGSLSVHQEGAFTPIQIRRESPREAV